jgi:hypothetical protein
MFRALTAHKVLQVKQDRRGTLAWTATPEYLGLHHQLVILDQVDLLDQQGYK